MVALSGADRLTAVFPGGPSVFGVVWLVRVVERGSRVLARAVETVEIGRLGLCGCEWVC